VRDLLVDESRGSDGPLALKHSPNGDLSDLAGCLSRITGFAVADTGYTVNTAGIVAEAMQAELKPVELAETHTTVALSGSIDMVGIGEIENTFIDYTVARKKHALVDMSAVDFLGSMGIRVFVSTAKALLRDQKKLVLFAAQPSIEKTLMISGFTSIVQVVPSLEDAKAMIGV
jgi:anti-anti-sigma factor